MNIWGIIPDAGDQLGWAAPIYVADSDDRARDEQEQGSNLCSAVVIGNARKVREKIEKMRERTGFEILVAMLQFGVLNNELTRRNMELFASEVMSQLRY